jgi:hypothetical protein
MTVIAESEPESEPSPESVLAPESMPAPEPLALDEPLEEPLEEPDEDPDGKPLDDPDEDADEPEALSCISPVSRTVSSPPSAGIGSPLRPSVLNTSEQPAIPTTIPIAACDATALGRMKERLFNPQQPTLAPRPRTGQQSPWAPTTGGRTT